LDASETTLPTTMTLGASISSDSPFAARPSVVVTIFCRFVVPQVIAASGVSAGFPASRSLAAISFALAAPMRTTTTSDPPAILDQSSRVFEPASRPVTTVTDDE